MGKPDIIFSRRARFASEEMRNWSTLPVEKNENRSWNLFWFVLGGAVVFVGFINGWSFL